MSRARGIRRRAVWMVEVLFILALAAFSMHGITLVWDANTDVDLDGYVVYSGTNSHSYNTRNFVGNITSNQLSGLLGGIKYFFAVTARNTSGLESDFSNEVTVRLPTNLHPPVVSYIQDVTIPMGSSTAALPFMIGDWEIPASDLFVSASSGNPSLVLSSGIKLSGSGSTRYITITPDATKLGTAAISVYVSNGAMTTTNIFKVNVGGGRPVESDLWLTSSGLKLIWSSNPWSLFRVFYKTNISDSAWTQASLDLVSVGPTTSWTDSSFHQSPSRFYRVVQVE
ncbi:MAG TPA: hypothetical protein VMZ27_17675 [Candidatus Saccharimonadales bacterium]|nr:hypothetical protein [Candidatus Saccharimonadales bacterium]